MQTRKILISAYACEPGKGSEFGNGWNWALHMAGQGNSVWCFTSLLGKESIEKSMSDNPVENLTFVFVDVPILVNKLYVNEFGVFLHYMVWQAKAAELAISMHREIHFDLVHHVTYGSYKLGSGMWKLDVPFVFGPVGGGQRALIAFKRYFGNQWRIEIFRDYFEKSMFYLNRNFRNTVRKADLLYVSNLDTLENLKKKGAKNLELLLDTSLPASFYPDGYPERKAENTLKILWVGRIIPLKALPLTLEGLSLLVGKFPFKLTVVGDGHFRKHVNEWVAQYGLEGYVECLGRIPWDDVRKQYLQHDLFMFTSLRDSCPAQLLEAMAFGLPVVTLNIHGARTLVPDNAGVKVDADAPSATVERLAAAVEYLYRNPEKRSEMGLNGYRFAKTQTWDNKTFEVNRKYNQLIHRK